jgi:hypothetical protein
MPSDDPPRLPKRPTGDGPRKTASAQLVAVRGPSATTALTELQARIAAVAVAVLRQRDAADLLICDADLVTAAGWIAEQCRPLLAETLLAEHQRLPTAREIVAALHARQIYADETAVREIVALVGLELRPEP